MKKWFVGKKFSSNNKIIAETIAYFEDLNKSYYMERIKKFDHRWTKCISLKRDYVEK
ncbi:hypothetical protein ALC57_13526 [Trachymyrmex cornetzi]|uniref:Uncharacterized protein n=1 Tax=Trachymyrmex cornetzi TaxID=471704 RepID=A0A195DPE7_9HYME|nr:hypothetical protein ALC57_13526 [Trachymyrmex cornetzi]